jgi:mannose-6-phosphate isomerase class I
MNYVVLAISALALFWALSAFRSVQNWEREMREEIRHLELRVDGLMEVVRMLTKKNK